MEEVIKKILELAVYAPSGDNMQPWDFELSNNTLRVFNQPQKDLSLYNYRQQGALLGLGALLENISIISPAYGYSAQTEILPPNTPTNCVATIDFSKVPISENELYPYIKLRCTNRTEYKDEPLAEGKKQYLLSSKIDGLNFKITDNPNVVKSLSYTVSQGDRLIFENKTVHDFLFNHIRWTDEEEHQKKDGLYLKAMELKPPQVAAFKLFQNWNVMKIFNMIGFPKMAVKGNASIYMHGCGFGAIIISDFSDTSYLQAGRLMQQIWLKITKLELALQPVGGLALLMRIIEEKNYSDYFSHSQVELIKKNYSIIKESFGVSTGQHIAFMFRFGFPKTSPSGRSSRKPPEIKIKK